jgi:hypothetical protein
MKEEENFNFDEDFDNILDDKDNPSLKPSDDIQTQDFEKESDADMDPILEEGKPKVRKSNFLFIGIGVIVVAVAGYFIYNILFPSAPPAQPQRPAGFQMKPIQPMPNNNAQQQAGAQKNMSNNAAMPNQQAEQPNANMQGNASANQNMSQSSMSGQQSSQSPMIVMSQQDMKTLLSGFAKMVADNSANINNQEKAISTTLAQMNQTSSASNNALAANINNLQQGIQTLTTNLSAYDKHVQDVSVMLARTQQQLTLLLAQQSAQVQRLTLRAVVPGRAWLVDANGNTTTVTVGSDLQNYGKVVRIDSDKGEVIMSTGYIFK